jgi:hypothetical protein
MLGFSLRLVLIVHTWSMCCMMHMFVSIIGSMIKRNKMRVIDYDKKKIVHTVEFIFFLILANYPWNIMGDVIVTQTSRYLI